MERELRGRWVRYTDYAALYAENQRRGGTELVHSSYVAETTAKILALTAERDRAVEALRELVACKDLKERIKEIVAAEDCNIVENTRWSEWVSLNNEYNERKAAAWAAARASLAGQS